MTQTACEQISEMTATTERTLASTFGWATHEERLYRECPTAFWLAPDGDGVLPPPLPGPVMPTIVIPRAPDPAEDHPTAEVEGMLTAVFRALIVAGPIFAAMGMMLLHNEADRFWWTPLARALTSLVAVPLTVPFGALLAALPVLTGVLLLGILGTTFQALRKPSAWGVTGGILGAVIATIFDAGGPIGIALIATSIACAFIARGAVAWTDPQPA